MTQGFRITQQNGQVVDITCAAATFVDLIQCPAGGSGTVDYPHLAGREVFVSEMNASTGTYRLHESSVAYPYGFPSVSYFPRGGYGPNQPSIFLVFAR